MNRLKKRKSLVVQHPEHKDITSSSTEDYVITKWNERPITKHKGSNIPYIHKPAPNYGNSLIYLNFQNIITSLTFFNNFVKKITFL